MPRRRRLRKVVAPPGFKGYKPFGTTTIDKNFIELLYEEYEAIKLADYDLLNHKEASELMGVSRATFARIYESARRKIATAFVDVKEIRTTYGNAFLDKDWLVCNKCNSKFTIPNNSENHFCPLCKSLDICAMNNN